MLLGYRDVRQLYKHMTAWLQNTRWNAALLMLDLLNVNLNEDVILKSAYTFQVIVN